MNQGYYYLHLYILFFFHLSIVFSNQSIDYAKSKSKATLVQEHGPSALYNPSLFSSTANAGATSQMNGRVTISSAQAEARGREKKRAREEAGGQEDEDEEGERGSKVQKTADNDDDDDGGEFF